METDTLRLRLAAIMSADVREYTRLMRQDEAATVQTLKSYREIMTSLITQHHGRVVDSPGDNVLSEFASVVDAVQSAVAIQKELKLRNASLDENRRMEFRIGINLGDVIVDGDRIYGDGVKLSTVLPGHSKEKINAALREKGLDNEETLQIDWNGSGKTTLVRRWRLLEGYPYRFL